ncbi:Putative NOP protein chaperone 1 [Septoria linicola]|uniref:NOP protein chaperone 1 n=1 Tax=Septoria linicola TaxID=215465 RepID=A0A9Q9EF90_9PEZI|nr:putative NOP protein chaperone 1 [Septoria linicola]USW49546.1 Putative NOP protein chaperone 1 [Septoria linicola]
MSAPMLLPHESSGSSTVSSEKRPSDDTAPASVSSSHTSLSEVDSEPASDSEASQDSSSADDEVDAEDEEEQREPAQVTSGLRPFGDVASSKPKIDHNLVMAYAKELEAKLHAFLPQLRQANSKLSEHSAKLNMENVNENEQHIEMNLDLGVLEQQPSGTARSTGNIKLRPEHTSGEDQELLPRDVSVTRLLSGQSDQPKPSIEVVEPGGIAHELPQRPGPVPS